MGNYLSAISGYLFGEKPLSQMTEEELKAEFNSCDPAGTRAVEILTEILRREKVQNHSTPQKPATKV